ncbi:Fanconi anemia group D2 protein [Chamberlinius hualienensis]
MSLLRQILSKSGVQLQDTGQVVIDVDSVMFIKNLTSNLKDHSRYPAVVNDFVTEFSEFIEDKTKFRKCLCPALFELGHNTGQQDSLIRLLLKTDDIQPKLCNILLEKAVELSADELNMSADSQIPKLILFQFKWLDTLIDSEGFCNKLLEVFSVLDVELQKNIIALVPEIIDDKSHYVIAATWNEKLKENPELTIPLLHSLTNLNVSLDVLEEMQSTAMKLIESVDVNDIPAVVKIILQNLSETTALDMLQDLKTKLNSLFDAKSSVTARSGTRSTEVLVLDSFQSSVRFQKSTGDNFLKLLDPEKNTDMNKFYCLDFFILLMLMSTRSWQKKSEQVVVSCIRKGLLTEKILEVAFQCHPQICIEYFKSVKHLGEMLVKKSEIVLRNFGGLVYHLSFSQLNDNAIAHQVIMNLIPHVRSGIASEIDEALDTLLNLAKTNKKILSFGVYLKSLLDYIGTMSLPHVRKIYDVLGHVIHNRFSSTDKPLEDDLYIIVRKQLSNSNPSYRLMGVVGAVNDLKFIVSSEGEISESDFKLGCDLVRLIEIQTEKDFCARALYYDEMSAMLAINDVAKKFQNWLTEHMASSFQDNFIMDAVEENITKISAIKGNLQFNLDAGAEDSIAINLLGISLNSSGRMEVTNRCMDSCLAPHFRLLQKCEMLTSESLEGIDAVLGCAVHFVSETIMDRFLLSFEKERKFVTRCCFTLINFFIELINAFSHIAEEEVRRKVLGRFKTLVMMREKLATFLPTANGYIPFVTRPDIDESAAVVYNTNAASVNGDKKRKAKSGRSKPSKKVKANKISDHDDESESRCSLHNSDDELDDEDKPTKNAATKINWSRYQVHFRELDLEVFYLLKAEMFPVASTSSPKQQLSIKELLFLYDDLLGKLKVVTEVSQTTSVKRVNFGFKGKVVASNLLNRNLLSRPLTDVIDSLLSLLRFARRHLDNLLNYMGLTSDVPSTAESIGTIEHVEEAANLCDVILSVIEASLNLASASKQRFGQAIKSLVPHGTDRNSQEDVIAASKMYLLRLMDRSPGLSIAVAALRCLHNSKSVFEEMELDLFDVADKILSTNWKNPDRKLLPIRNADIAHLLRIWLDSSDNPLSLIENCMAEVLNDELDGDEDNAKHSLISKKTLHVFCEVFYEKIIETLEKKRMKKEKRRENVIENQYKEWRSAFSVFHNLISLIKEHETVQILAISLKHSKRFLSLFSRFGLPVLNDLFRAHKDDILQLFKVLQQCTRVLQNVCSHSKVSKNLNLTNKVPLLKKELERIIFNVKKLLASNNCSNAFLLGNLKNRTLKGEEILSQENERGNDTSEDENEEVKEVQQHSASDNETGDDETGYQSECY